MYSGFLSVGLGVFGGLLLKAFYSLVRHSSPRSYTYSASHLECSRGKVALQYVAFRAVPVFMVSLGLVVTVERLGLDRGLALIACIVVFSCLSSVKSIVDGFLSERGGAVFHSLLQSFGIVVSASIAFFAYLFASPLSLFVPEPKEFVNAVWTAVFVASFYYFVSDVTRRSQDMGIEARVELVVRDIGGGLWEWARASAQREGVPWCVVAAIMVIEVSERPRWMRGLERMGSGLLGNKVVMSFGVTQERSRTPLSDKTAIERTIQAIKAALKPESIAALENVSRQASSNMEYYNARETAFSDVRQFAHRRNPDGRYADTVVRFAREIQGLGR